MAAIRKTKPADQTAADQTIAESGGVTLEQTLKEEGESSTPESISQSLSPHSTEVDGPSRMDRAIQQ